MKNILALLLAAGIAALMVILTGCGTVSDVSPAPGAKDDLRKYDRVLVLDFADDVSGKAKPADYERKKSEMALATRWFPDRIASELTSRGAFHEVMRTGEPDPDTLVISGTITRYVAGDTAGRFFVGLGVGSSYFDATVELTDGTKTNLLATQKVDKNSWVLGGGFAATQTPDEFMREAAKRPATDVATAKRTGKFPGIEEKHAQTPTKY